MTVELRTSEWIAIVYHGYLAGLAVLQLVGEGKQEPAFVHARKQLLAVTTLMVSVIVSLGISKGSAGATARDWMPLIYLLVGYWLPAQLVRTSNPRLEKKLLEIDHSLFGANGLATFANRAPRFAIACLELVYLLCYPFAPIGFAWLLLAGFREQADRFWTAVLLAGFTCYSLLPWLPTRAPRVIEHEPGRPRSSIRALNLLILDRASVQLNTFPSGHTALSLATALAVGVHSPVAGAVLGVSAFGIALGSVVGRYHYVADAIAGAVVACAAFAISRMI